MKKQAPSGLKLVVEVRRVRQTIRTDVSTGVAKTKCVKITCIISTCGPGSLGYAE